MLSINRNIVECKADKVNDKARGTPVLIETSWNVKIEYTAVSVNDMMVLIETSWNVKTMERRSKIFWWRINRNIVECKESRKKSFSASKRY